MPATARTDRDQFGRRVIYDEVQVGMEIGPQEWEFSLSDIDNQCQFMQEYHEYYSVGSPFGGRIGPMLIAYLPPRRMFTQKYYIRGLFVGYDHRQADVLRPNTPYILNGRVSNKYVRRGREYLEYEVACTDSAGTEIFQTTRRHVIDFSPRVDDGEILDSVADPAEGVLKFEGSFFSASGEDEQSDLEEVHPYGPPLLDRNTPLSSGLADQSQADLLVASDFEWFSKGAQLGSELPPTSLQLSWRLTRDLYELSHHKVGLPPIKKIARQRNIHLDYESARLEGLDEPNAAGPQAVSTISRMMAAVGGDSWFKRGSFKTKLIRQMGLSDFVTAKGFVKRRELREEGVEITCEVWVENQKGEKTVVGEASFYE